MTRAASSTLTLRGNLFGQRPLKRKMIKLSRLMLIVAVLMAGSVTIGTWFIFRHSHARTQKLFLGGPPCRGGLVSVDSQPDCPVKITIANTACDHTRVASVNFIAENISASPITEFEIDAIGTYDDLVDQSIG